MKKVKAAVSVLLVALLLVLAPFPGADAQAARILRMNRAVQIDDQNIVVEFSEPVAYNLKKPDSTGPWTSIRLVDKKNLNIAKYEGEPYDGQWLQWSGSCCFTDSNHDKVLFTLAPGNYEVRDINDITSFNGPLAKYKDVYTVQFVIEEILYREDSPGDGCLDNITTADGEVRLWTELSTGAPLDRVSLPITVDYDYEIDLSKVEPLVSTGPVNMHILSIPDEAPTAEPDGEQPDAEQLGAEQPVRQAPNIARIAGWLGGGVVVAAVGCVGLMFLIRKAGKAK